MASSPTRRARRSPPPPSTTSSAGACSRVALAVLASSGAWDYVRMLVEIALFVAVVAVVVRPAAARACCGTRHRRARRSCCPTALAGAYVTDAIGIHAVFGAFLVGAAMPRPDAEHTLKELRRRLSPVIAFLAPIYFVTSGMAVDIPGLRAGDLADLVLIIAAACAGKFLGAFARRARHAGWARATRRRSAC